MTADRPLVVSVVVADGLVGSFGLGVCAEVFGYDRRPMGLPRFDFALVSEAPGVMRTDTGIPITVEHGLERLARSDIVSITAWEDRKSTRLNSSHANISYAVFCLKKNNISYAFF